MFGSLGITELLVIGGVALLIFGPSQLPKFGRSLGSTIKEFRAAGKQLQGDPDDINNELGR